MIPGRSDTEGSGRCECDGPRLTSRASMEPVQHQAGLPPVSTPLPSRTLPSCLSQSWDKREKNQNKASTLLIQMPRDCPPRL